MPAAAGAAALGAAVRRFAAAARPPAGAYRVAAALRSATRRHASSQWVPASQFGTLYVESARVPVTIRALDGSLDSPQPSDVDGLTNSAYVDASGISNDDLRVVENGTDVGVDASVVARGSLKLWVPYSMGVVVQTGRSDADGSSADGSSAGGGDAKGDDSDDNDNRGGLGGVSNVIVDDDAAEVDVAGIEGAVSVFTIHAPVTLRGIKGTVTALTDTGSVTASSIQGNVDVATVAGDVALGKIQAIDMKVLSEGGSVSARAIYSERTLVAVGGSGSVTLGAVHGDSVVSAEDGAVFVGTAEGRLAVETDAGDIEAHLSDVRAAHLYSGSGSITLTASPDSPVALQIESGSGSVDLGVGKTESWEPGQGKKTKAPAKWRGVVGGSDGDGKKPAKVKIRTNGHVTFSAKSWFEASTGLTARLAGLNVDE